MTRPRSHSLDRPLAALVSGVGAALFVTLGVAGGCSFARQDAPIEPFHESGLEGGDDAVVVEIGDDVAPDAPVVHDKLCGEGCNPDLDFICEIVPHDGGPIDSAVDDAAGDASATDAPFDSFGSGTTKACRVERDVNKPVSTCALAGIAPTDAFCTRDADCRPGLACVGSPGRCLAYCCGATVAFDPCHTAEDPRFCAPLPLAERPADRVPVCIQPDNCTLLVDPEHDTKCLKSETCTVVTKYGQTSCVPVGTGLDLCACSADNPCNRGYVCLGPADDRRCRKLCHDGVDSECTLGKCTKAASIPTGFGICSAAADAGDTGGCH